MRKEILVSSQYVYPVGSKRLEGVCRIWCGKEEQGRCPDESESGTGIQYSLEWQLQAMKGNWAVKQFTT